jgi:hypothetical protein
MIAAAHPLDRAKLRHLGEMLVDISAGRLMTRDPLRSLVESLMASLRHDGSSAGAERVAERLISIASHRLGADIMAVMASGLIQASCGYATRAHAYVGARP